MNFDHVKARLAHPQTGLPEHQYEYWVGETAKVLKIPYMQVHGMVKDWTLEKIIRRYQECTKHNGDMPSEVFWWWRRKQDKEAEKKQST